MKKNQFKTCVMSTLKSLVKQYREDNYIDEDSTCHIVYNDGTLLNYPDDLDKIKLKNIKNIHFMGTDDSMDFNYDDICTPDTLETLKILPEIYHKNYENQLVVEDMEDYYRNHFNK